MLYSTLPHPCGSRMVSSCSGGMMSVPMYQTLRMVPASHPLEMDLDLAGMQQTTHFNHPVAAPSGRSSTSTARSLTSPIVVQTSNCISNGPHGLVPAGSQGQQVEGPICASSPKRLVSAFTTFGSHPRSNASTPMSPPSSSSDTPSPQVMMGSEGSQTGLLMSNKPISNGPVPTKGHLL